MYLLVRAQTHRGSAIRPALLDTGSGPHIVAVLSQSCHQSLQSHLQPHQFQVQRSREVAIALAVPILLEVQVVELAGGARVRGNYVVAEDQESGQGLVGHGLAVLAVLRRERGERTQHGMLLQGIITFLWNICMYMLNLMGKLY